MQIVEKKLSELHPYENNPRWNDDAVGPVANSIKEFGFKVPIVATSDGEIVNGHTRYKAAQKLGLETVPVIIADDLSDEQVKAFRLADNKVSEISCWDSSKLAEELSEIVNIDMGNFSFELEEELAKLDTSEDDRVEGDIPVSDRINFFNDYIVLKFETEEDWLQAQTFFNLEKRGISIAEKRKTKHIGIGRVLDGARIIKQLKEQEAVIHDPYNDN